MTIDMQVERTPTVIKQKNPIPSLIISIKFFTQDDSARGLPGGQRTNNTVTPATTGYNQTGYCKENYHLLT